MHTRPRTTTRWENSNSISSHATYSNTKMSSSSCSPLPHSPYSLILSAGLLIIPHTHNLTHSYADPCVCTTISESYKTFEWLLALENPSWERVGAAPPCCAAWAHDLAELSLKHAANQYQSQFNFNFNFKQRQKSANYCHCSNTRYPVTNRSVNWLQRLKYNLCCILYGTHSKTCSPTRYISLITKYGFIAN